MVLPMRDAALITAAQKAEHYEMTGMGQHGHLQKSRGKQMPFACCSKPSMKKR